MASRALASRLLAVLSREGPACSQRLATLERQCWPVISLREYWASSSGMGTAAEGLATSSVQGEQMAPGQQRRAFSAAQELGGSPSGEPELPPAYEVLERRIAGRYDVQPQPIFAVVEVGGTQHKVTADDLVITERLEGVDVNDVISLQRVLLVGTPGETLIGRPYVPGATVTAAVEEQFLDGKVLIFHKRRRKNSRRLRGHRQPLTTLRILSVMGLEAGGAAGGGAP